MYKFRKLFCYHCKSEIACLTGYEIEKLNGLNFQCECCGHLNLLNKTKLHKSMENDPFLNTFSFNTL